MDKEQLVHGVFQSVADSYDAANDRISLGMHHRWKRELVSAVTDVLPAQGGSILDLCCGTGDITLRLAREHSDAQVTGLDFSQGMLDVARQHVAAAALSNVDLVEGDAMHLDYPDSSFDAAVISFGLRNTPDYAQVVGEMTRVVRPGGLVACLDASVPDNRAVRPFYMVYYRVFMPLLGGGISKRDEYKWLYRSTQEFLNKRELAALFTDSGLERVGVRGFMCGSAALHTGFVPSAS